MTSLQPSLAFLADLKRHNRRNWFNAHRIQYESVRGAFRDFVFELIQAIQLFDASVGQVEPEDCIFRIYRDIRFSKDKSPYKTNFAAFIAREGRKSKHPGYYVHIEPRQSMIGGGIYMPPTDQLKKIRHTLLRRGKDLTRLVQDRKFKSFYGGLWDEDNLTRPPRGFPADDPNTPWLLYRHFIALHEFADREVRSARFLQRTAAGLRLMKPFKDFLERAL